MRRANWLLRLRPDDFAFLFGEVKEAAAGFLIHRIEKLHCELFKCINTVAVFCRRKLFGAFHLILRALIPSKRTFFIASNGGHALSI